MLFKALDGKNQDRGKIFWNYYSGSNLLAYCFGGQKGASHAGIESGVTEKIGDQGDCIIGGDITAYSKIRSAHIMAAAYSCSEPLFTLLMDLLEAENISIENPPATFSSLDLNQQNIHLIDLLKEKK
jgi:hypothetical protein